MRKLLLSLLAGSLSLQVACAQTASRLPDQSLPSEWPVQRFVDLLDLHQDPQSATDRSHNIFFDQGAWHGYALPPVDDTGTGFVGPFLSATGEGVWAGRRFGVVQVEDAATHHAIKLEACDHGGHALPGALIRKACGDGIVVRETLFFATASTTLGRINIGSEKRLTVDLALGGEQALETLPGGDSLSVMIPGLAAQPIQWTGDHYFLPLSQPVTLIPHHPTTVYLQQSYLPASNGRQLQAWSASPAEAWHDAGARWGKYLALGMNLRSEERTNRAAQRINAKAILTLLNNWRAPIGDLHHGGVIPSYSNPDFNAFWAWDSWKHAAALAYFAPDLAKDQVRAMFDFQLENGMIPDLISRKPADDNFRDSKPPLATWAVASIYNQTHDKAFVAEMFDKLYRYHRWWYADRDHGQDGLTEFGSTDGTRVAAGWESGMDNAVRFDDATMLKNHDKAWSLDQASVDLNCYLYQEKVDLAKMAMLLGKLDIAKQLRSEAAALRTRIQQVFFDPSMGYFFDLRLGSNSPIPVYGPEGWIPLFTGVATQDQALRVRSVLMDHAKFDTEMPFPTLARDDPRYSPVNGYWRGPVWIDQAVFAVQGFDRYGFTSDAAKMRLKLLTKAEDLAGQGTFRETYNPDTGAGQNSRNFSWSAAEYFLLLHGSESVLRQPLSSTGIH